MDNQSVVHGTVSTIPRMAKQVGGGAPGLFVIGAVAALGRDLAWFRSGPAFEQAA
jgi:siroheme synthase